MANESPKNSGGNFGRFSKTLAFWLLVILVPVAFLQFSSTKNDAAVKLGYSEYADQLDVGNIAKVTIVDGKDVTGEFNHEYGPVGQKASKKFTTMFAVKNSDRELQRLVDKHVIVQAEDPRPSFGSFIIAALPWLLMIGFWFFIM